MRAEVYPEMSQKAVARIREDSETWRSRQQTTAPTMNHLKVGWPELHIARTAQVEPADITADWVDYLNDLGGRNRNGVAASLGSVALVYVGAKPMGRMLEDKYQVAYQDPKRTARLQKKIAVGIRDFVRSERDRLYDDVTVQFETAHEVLTQLVPGCMNSDFLPQADFGLDFDEEDQGDAAEADWRGREILLPADARLELRQTQTLFSDLTLQATNIELYGDDGYGLNLSNNAELYEERRALLQYLRIDEKLDVGRLTNDDWHAHATIFTPRQPLRSSQLVVAAERPATIAFDQPRAF